MEEYRIIPTSAEVWAVLHARHGKELKVFSTYSAPGGDEFGDPSIAVMFTAYGFACADDYPVMEARTTWRVNPEKSYEREGETTEYWLCIPLKSDDE